MYYLIDKDAKSVDIFSRISESRYHVSTYQELRDLLLTFSNFKEVVKTQRDAKRIIKDLCFEPDDERELLLRLKLKPLQTIYVFTYKTTEKHFKDYLKMLRYINERFNASIRNEQELQGFLRSHSEIEIKEIF